MSAGRAGKTAKIGLNPVRRRAGGVARRNGSRAIRSLRWQRLSPAPMIYLISNSDIWQHPEECKSPQPESEHPDFLYLPPFSLPVSLSSPLRFSLNVSFFLYFLYFRTYSSLLSSSTVSVPLPTLCLCFFSPFPLLPARLPLNSPDSLTRTAWRKNCMTGTCAPIRLGGGAEPFPWRVGYNF